jgi:hypothetical protein
MAKKPTEKREIESVTLKDDKEVIDLPLVGMTITKENLTVDRYEKLMSLSTTFGEKFNVKFKPKKDEQSKVETKE